MKGSLSGQITNQMTWAFQGSSWHYGTIHVRVGSLDIPLLPLPTSIDMTSLSEYFSYVIFMILCYYEQGTHRGELSSEKTSDRPALVVLVDGAQVYLPKFMAVFTVITTDMNDWSPTGAQNSPPESTVSQVKYVLPVWMREILASVGTSVGCDDLLEGVWFGRMLQDDSKFQILYQYFLI